MDQNNNEIQSLRELAAGAPSNIESDLGEIQFRIVTSQGTRRAFKLERIFWKVLELAASSKRTPFGGYVDELVTDCDPSDNKASLLRVHAAAWLSQKLVDASSRSLGNKVLSDIIQAVPTPCLWINGANAVAGQNQAFLNLLGNLETKTLTRTETVVRIKFQKNSNAVREQLRTSKKSYSDDVIAIHYGSEHVERHARIVALNSLLNRPLGLLVFVAE